MSEKEQKAINAVKNHMWMAMGAGLIPVPWADLTAIAGVQLKLLAKITKIYDIPFQKNLGKTAIGSLLGFVLPHAMTCGSVGSLLKFIPVVGVMVGAPTQALFSGAYTWALGNVFIQHFESGGTFLTFKPEQVREYFQAQFEEGQKMATTMGKGKKEVKVSVPGNSSEA